MSNRSKRGINEKNKKRITSAALALLSFTAYMPVSTIPVFAETIGGAAGNLNMPSIDSKNIINGEVEYTAGSKNMNVNVVGGIGTVGQFDWNSFNVAKGNTVNFGFSANSQTALNRVLNGGGMSQIYGTLTNGSTNGCAACVNTSKVILINPSGILFGNGSAGASVNLNSFTASTYDIKGAKDISSMSASELNTYKGTGGKTGTIWTIAGSATDAGAFNDVQFVANDNMVDGNGFLNGDATGRRLAKIESNGSTITGDKHLAFVGNDIDIKNSTLSSHYNSTPNTNSTPAYTVSGVKLVTGDGVNFYYASSGNSKNAFDKIAGTHTQNEAYGISIDNSTVQGGRTTIYAGGQKASGTFDNSINITKSTIRGKKTLGGNGNYLYGTDGNVEILGRNQSVTIENSDVQTINDKVGNDANYTKNADLGNLKIEATKDITIKNSQIRTADSTQNASALKSGNITITSTGGSVNISDNGTVVNGADSSYTENGVVSAGNLTIQSGKDVNITGYKAIKAKGNPAISTNPDNRTVQITAGNNVNATNSTINATTVDIYAGNNVTTTGSTIVAGNDLSVKSKQTTFDNTFLAYNDIELYDTSRTSNVKFSNGTKVRDKNASGNLVLTTNGNIEVNKAHLMNYDGTTASTQNSIELNSLNGDITVTNGSNLVGANGKVELNATNGAITVDGAAQAQSVKGNVNLNAKNDITVSGTGTNIATANGTINIKSTAGNVNANNNSRIQTANTGGSINITANKNVTVDSSARVSANKGDANIKATTGKISVKTAAGATNDQRSRIQAIGGNANLTQGADMNVDTDFANGTVSTSGKLTIKTDGSIVSTQLKSGTGTLGSYTDLVSLNNDNAGAKFIFAGDKRMELNAGNDITSTAFVSTNDVDMVAGKNISLTNNNTTSDQHILLQNTTTKSGTNGTTTVKTANGDLRTNNYTIKGGKKTTLEGKSVTSDAGTVIDTQANKLALNSTGTIDVTVKNMDKTKPANGLDINADLNTSKDQSAIKDTMTVKVKADDGNLVVSKIKANTLDLVADNIYAGSTTIDRNTDHVNNYTDATSGLSDAQISNKAYIEVKKQGGFNIDKSSTYGSNANITYNANASSTVVDTQVGTKINGTEHVVVRPGTTQTEVETRPQNESVYAGNLKGTKLDIDYSTGTRLTDKDVPTSNISDGKETIGATQIYDGDDPQYKDSKGHWIITEYEREHELYTQYEYKQTQTDTYYVQQRTNTYAQSDVYAQYNSVDTIKDNQHVATLNSSQQQGFVVVYDKTRTENNGTTDRLVAANGKVYLDGSGNIIDAPNGAWGHTPDNATFNVVTSAQDSGHKTVVTSDTAYTKVWKADPSLTTKEWCKDDVPPGTDRGESNSLILVDDFSAAVRNPKKAEQSSNATPYQANIARAQDTIIAAAGRLEYADEEATEEQEDSDSDGIDF